MSAYLFSAAPGVGKTYTGTAFALYALERAFRVAVNWDMIPPEGVALVDLRKGLDAEGRQRKPISIREANAIDGPVLFRYDEFADIIGLVECAVYHDEAQATTGARDWEGMSKRIRLWLSMHRHYRCTLFFFSQHYKFVDVYFRRIAVGNVSTLGRFLNLTFEFPRPEADPETGELGKPDFFGTKLIIRPWKDLDLPNPLPGFWDLLRVSRLVPAHYFTHQPRDSTESGGKIATTSADPQAGPPPRPQNKKQIPML
jgi:hypothetical protein